MDDTHAGQPKDIRVEVTIRNNLILARMESVGIKNVAELSRLANITQSRLGELVNMKALPTKKAGGWFSHVLRLADFFQCMPEDLFSEFQQERPLDRNRSHAEMRFGEVHAMLAAQQAPLLEPDAVAETHELRAVLEQAIGSLSPRAQEVIRARFGLGEPEMTLDEVGEKFGVTRERVRQIETKALRLLRHGRRAVLIREAAGIES